MHELGVIHGRFQLLHNDHLKYLLAGKQRCRHLVIGITNPDPTLTRADPADPARTPQGVWPTAFGRGLVAHGLARLHPAPSPSGAAPS